MEDLELDVPELETDLEELETETPEGEEETPESETDKPKDETDKPVAPAKLFDGKKLTAGAKEALAKLKEEAPGVAKSITKALYRVAELDREFPGGLKEARELRSAIEEYGGVAGLATLKTNLGEFDSIAAQFDAADPAFVEDMVTSNAQSFAKLAPVVFAKYAEIHPEGFEAYVGRIVFNDMNRAGLPLLMSRMQDVLGENPKALEYFEQLNSYLGAFRTMAEKPIDLTKVKAGEKPPANDALNKREEELTAKEWKMDRDSVQRSMADLEYRQALAGRKPSTEEKADILERFQMKAANLAAKVEPKWAEKSQRFIANKDKAGYLRFMKSLYARVIPDAMSEAVNKTLRSARPTGGKAPLKRAATPGQKRAANEGFKPVPEEPGSYDIDYGRTPDWMVKQNRAILNDGRRVSWT
jgi:signal recognition particle subunit SEC65